MAETITWPEMLDVVVAQTALALGINATRDPSKVPGMVAQDIVIAFVGFPTQYARLLAGANVDVPISLVASSPPDIRAVDALLTHVDTLIAFAGPSVVSNGPLSFGDIQFPAVTVTARVAIQTQETE